MVDRHTVNKPFVEAKLTVVHIEFILVRIEVPKFDSSIVTSHKTIWVAVIEFDVHRFLIVLVRGRLHAFRSALGHIPAYNLVSVFFSA